MANNTSFLNNLRLKAETLKNYAEDIIAEIDIYLPPPEPLKEPKIWLSLLEAAEQLQMSRKEFIKKLVQNKIFYRDDAKRLHVKTDCLKTYAFKCVGFMDYEGNKIMVSNTIGIDFVKKRLCK